MYGSWVGSGVPHVGQYESEVDMETAVDWTFVNLNMLRDVLTLGGVGFVAGVLTPGLFMLIGYVIESVKLVIWR